MSVSVSGFRARRPAALVAVALIELLEAAGITLFAVLLIAAGPGSPYPMTAYGAGGTVLILAVLLFAVGVGTLRRSPWTRTAGLLWHVVQILLGLYALTGAGPVIGFAALLIAPAAVVIVLLCLPPVSAALRRT